MRSYAAAYKMCGDVSSAESQRDGPIALCWPTRSRTTAISCMGREPVLPQEAGVSSYHICVYDKPLPLRRIAIPITFCDLRDHFFIIHLLMTGC